MFPIYFDVAYYPVEDWTQSETLKFPPVQSLDVK